MAAQSLHDHARRKDLRRHVAVLRGRVLPALVVWWLVVIAFAVGVPPMSSASDAVDELPTCDSCGVTFLPIAGPDRDAGMIDESRCLTYLRQYPALLFFALCNVRLSQ